MSAGTSQPAPKFGRVVVMRHLPPCDFCDNGNPAQFDFKTKAGPWAYGCAAHWCEQAATLELGVGLGQRLILESEASA